MLCWCARLIYCRCDVWPLGYPFGLPIQKEERSKATESMDENFGGATTFAALLLLMAVVTLLLLLVHIMLLLT